MQSFIPAPGTRQRHFNTNRLAPSRYVAAPRPAARRLPMEMWEGFMSESAADYKRPFCIVHDTLVQDAENGAEIAARILLSHGDNEPAPAQVRITTSGNYSASIGPYVSADTGLLTMGTVRGTIEGNRINGTFTSVPVQGGEERQGHFSAIRVRLAG
jgi:hypothetical protein